MNEDSECSGRLLSYGLGLKRENKRKRQMKIYENDFCYLIFISSTRRDRQPSQMRERKKESTDPDPDPSHYYVTNTSVHLPVPSYQTHCSGLPCVRFEKDSLPSVLSFVGYANCLNETIHTFTYSSHISMKNCRIPSSFLPSCSSTIFVSDISLSLPFSLQEIHCTYFQGSQTQILSTR